MSNSNDISPTYDAFRMHDEKGVPLTAWLAMAKERDVFVNLATFAIDAFIAGWTLDRLKNCLVEACSDNNRPFKWDEFKTRLSTLFVYYKGDWKAAREFVVNHTDGSLPA